MVNDMKENTKKLPKIGIALGSGGSRGFAHIGFLRAFEEEGIPISVIAGASIGSIVGGLYAEGVSLTQMEKVCKTIKRTQLFDIANPSKGGIIRGDKATKIIERILDDAGACKTFEECKIKFGCVATDLLSGKVVYQTKGDLLPAIHASFSIGSVFAPVEKDGMLLIDAGNLARVPVRLARSLGADFVVGVDCAGPTMPLEKSDLNSYSKVATRVMLLMEYEASKDEMNEADILVSFDNSKVDPLSIKAGLATIEYGYKEGKRVAKKLKTIFKHLNAK